MINWTLEKRSLDTLKDHPHNPRKMSKHDAEQLKSSLQRFGIIDKPVITPDGQIIGGHQRKKILKQLKIKEVDCWVPDRDLTQEEIDELCIRLNRNTGEWDFEKLANEWDMSGLLEWGFDEKEFELLASDNDATTIAEDNEPSEYQGIALSIHRDDMTSFENQLDDLLAKFPRAKAKKVT